MKKERGLRKGVQRYVAISLALLMVSVGFAGVGLYNAEGQGTPVTLPVPYFHQGRTNWCFPTSLSMILQYYGKNVHPWDIVAFWNLGHDDGVSMLAYLIGEGSINVHAYVESYGLTIDGPLLAGNWNFDFYKNNLDLGAPVIFSGFASQYWGLWPGAGHSIVVVGYEEGSSGQYIYVHDPSGFFTANEWELSTYPHMYVKVLFTDFVSYFTNWFNLLTFQAYVVHGVASPPQGVIFMSDRMELPIHHTSDVGNTGWLYIGNQFAWSEDQFVWEDCLANGQEILLNEVVVIRLSVSNQFDVSKEYQINLDLRKSSDHSLVYSDNEVLGGSDSVSARSVRETIFVVPKTEISKLEPGDYYLSFGLWKPNPDYNIDSPHDFMGPIEIKFASNFGRNPEVLLYDDAEVWPGDSALWPWTVDVYANFNAYSHILNDNRWYWSFYADAYMIGQNNRVYLDTGKNELKFQLFVYADGDMSNPIWTSGSSWFTTNTDNDDIYGDYSHKGGKTPAVMGPVLSQSDMPQRLTFNTKWKLSGAWWGHTETDELYSVELIPDPPDIPYIVSITIDDKPTMKEEYNIYVTVANPLLTSVDVTLDLTEEGALANIGDIVYDPSPITKTIAAGSTETFVFTPKHTWRWLDPIAHEGATGVTIFALLLAKVPILGDQLTLLSAVAVLQERDLAIPYNIYDYSFQSGTIADIPSRSATVEVPKDKQNALNTYINKNLAGDILTVIASKLILIPSPWTVIPALGMLAAEGLLIISANDDYNHAVNPDCEYTEIVVPEYIDVPEIEGVGPNPAIDLAKHTIELQGDTKAMWASIARYNNASEHKDEYYMAKQMEASKEYIKMVIEDYKDIDRALGDTLEYLAEKGFTLTYADVEAIKNDIETNGLPEEEVHILKRNGFSDDEISEIIKGIITLDNKYYLDYDYYLPYFGDLATLFMEQFAELQERRGGTGVGLVDIAPVADAGLDQTSSEGETVHFDGSRSYDIDGEIISYEWDFDGDGSTDATGPNPTYVWYDNGVFLVTLTITTITTITETDEDGNVFTSTITQTDTDTTTVTVLNLDPTASIDCGYMYVDFTLRFAGEKWHNVYWDLYETDEAEEEDGIGDGGQVGHGELLAHLECVRYPGDPDAQSDSVYDVYIDAEKIYYSIATYYPYEDDMPISGQPHGSNPTWIDMTFEDGSTERIHHNFNEVQSIVRDSDHWVHRHPWPLDFSPWLVTHTWTFNGSTTDQGTDDETFTWDWDDETPFDIAFYTYRRPDPTTDPFPSPYDRDEGAYPVDITDTQYHVYMMEDDFVPELTITDDDYPAEGEIENDGMALDSLDVDAIHTREIQLPDGTKLARK